MFSFGKYADVKLAGFKHAKWGEESRINIEG